MDLKADKKALKSLLAIDEQQFRIPPYQRPYSWTSEEVDDLWEDLVDNLGGGHFLGSLVLNAEDPSRPQVIDGQQRLTTLMLLLSVLRDACHERGMVRQVAQIDKRMIADDLAEGDAAFKFKTGSANWPVFRDVVLRGPSDPDRKHPTSFDKAVRARNRPLLDNQARLRRHLAEALAVMSDVAQPGWLEAFHKFLMERVELVVIEVRSLADAFLLFETLNDRGLQLSAADLLKSHLLGEVAKRADDEDVDAAAAQWDVMLDALGPQVDVTRFLRHYLLGRYPKVQQDGVFDNFKLIVASDGVRAVLHDLTVAAGHYGDFENPGRVGHEPTRRILEDLQTLRATVCYIALGPARRHLSERDFLEFARLAEVLTYRYSSVASRSTKNLERPYHEAAKLLADPGGPRLVEARAVLIELMPTADEFLLAFDRLSMGRQYLLRYTLRKVEQSLSAGAEKEIKASDLVHIEHIMPQTLSAGWRSELGANADQHAEYVNRWGNLTLLFAGYNIPASNKVFNDKQVEYAKSDVALTQELCRLDRWGFAQIEGRQRRLGQLAERLWHVAPAATGGKAPADPVAEFRRELGDLWSWVEPLCIEVSAEEIRQLAERVPAHLEAQQHEGDAAEEIAVELTRVLRLWDRYDGAERSVVRAAVAYVLEADDAIPDHLPGGLEDDRAVVLAAAKVLASAS